MFNVTQDPDARLDYRLDLRPWLLPGEVITDATWTADPGLTVYNTSHDDTTATCWLRGGAVAGGPQDFGRYNAVCHVVTDQGREDDHTVQVTIAQQ